MVSPGPGRRYRKRGSPLSEYMSLHLSLKLTENSGPFFEKKMRYIFTKRSVSFVHYL